MQEKFTARVFPCITYPPRTSLLLLTSLYTSHRYGSVPYKYIPIAFFLIFSYTTIIQVYGEYNRHFRFMSLALFFRISVSPPILEWQNWLAGKHVVFSCYKLYLFIMSWRYWLTFISRKISRQDKGTTAAYGLGYFVCLSGLFYKGLKTIIIYIYIYLSIYVVTSLFFIIVATFGHCCHVFPMLRLC